MTSTCTTIPLTSRFDSMLIWAVSQSMSYSTRREGTSTSIGRRVNTIVYGLDPNMPAMYAINRFQKIFGSVYSNVGDRRYQKRTLYNKNQDRSVPLSKGRCPWYCVSSNTPLSPLHMPCPNLLRVAWVAFRCAFLCIPSSTRIKTQQPETKTPESMCTCRNIVTSQPIYMG